jgi:hypothetical protein
MPHRFLIVAALFLCAAAASPSFDAMISINYANPITSFTSSSDCSRSSSSSSFMGVNCSTVRALNATVRQHPSQNYPLRCASISHSPTTPPCGTTSPWMPSIGPSSGNACLHCHCWRSARMPRLLFDSHKPTALIPLATVGFIFFFKHVVLCFTPF